MGRWSAATSAEVSAAAAVGQMSGRGLPLCVLHHIWLVVEGPREHHGLIEWLGISS